MTGSILYPWGSTLKFVPPSTYYILGDMWYREYLGTTARVHSQGTYFFWRIFGNKQLWYTPTITYMFTLTLRISCKRSKYCSTGSWEPKECFWPKKTRPESTTQTWKDIVISFGMALCIYRLNKYAHQTFLKDPEGYKYIYICMYVYTNSWYITALVRTSG